LLGNAQKAKTELNWEPKTSVQELVCEMVQADLKALEEPRVADYV